MTIINLKSVAMPKTKTVAKAKDTISKAKKKISVEKPAS